MQIRNKTFYLPVVRHLGRRCSRLQEVGRVHLARAYDGENV
jgi:hypothetical protein